MCVCVCVHTFIFHYQNAGQNPNTKMGNKSLKTLQVWQIVTEGTEIWSWRLTHAICASKIKKG